MTPFRTHMSSQVLAVVIYTELISLENIQIECYRSRTGACGANIASQLGHLCGNLGQGAEQPPEQPSRSEESPGPTVDRGAVSTTPVTSVERLDDGHDGPGLSRNKGPM